MRRRAVVQVCTALVCTALVVSACAVPDPDRERTRQRLGPSDRATVNDPPATQGGGGDTGSDGSDAGGIRRLAKGPISNGWRVTRIVDGDTVDVTSGRRTLTLRLIGIDTPETVHPTEPIECFGPEASAFARRRLLGERAVLEFDRSQGRLDYYDRTLAYLWTTNGAARQFNRDAVRRGYATEYTYDEPYLWQREYLRAQAAAVSQRLGVWRCPAP